MARTGAVILLTAAALLAGCGGDIQTMGGDTLTKERAFEAAANNDLDTVMIALENGVMRVDDQDENGRTMLHYAAAGMVLNEAPQKTVAYWLLEDYGADPNIRDTEGHGALFYARENGNMLVANLIEGSGGSE